MAIPATRKQRVLLRILGAKVPKGLTLEEANHIIRLTLRDQPPTDRQVETGRKLGLTFETRGEACDRLIALGTIAMRQNAALRSGKVIVYRNETFRVVSADKQDRIRGELGDEDIIIDLRPVGGGRRFDISVALLKDASEAPD
jgi:hypothetical protein